MHRYSRRQRGGGAKVAAVAAQYGFVALYNDSSIGHILRVLYWQVSAGAAANAVAFFVNGTVGALVARGLALFAGEQDMAGVIYSGSDVNAPPFGVIMAMNGGTAIAGERDPWFYIRPGFSLVVKSDTVNLGTSAAFWWSDLEMTLLDDCELV